MSRFAVFVLLSAAITGFTQTSAQNPQAQPPSAAVSEPTSQPLADAEAAMVKSDWKAAETRQVYFKRRTPAMRPNALSKVITSLARNSKAISRIR